MEFLTFSSAIVVFLMVGLGPCFVCFIHSQEEWVMRYTFLPMVSHSSTDLQEEKKRSNVPDCELVNMNVNNKCS